VTLAEKLRPDRFTAMSPKMTAIIGYVLGEQWTEPQISWMSVSSDGYVTTDSDFLGEAADLARNIRKLLIAAQLSPKSERSSHGCSVSVSMIIVLLPNAPTTPNSSTRGGKRSQSVQ
jgi:hypothetical protein